MARLIARAWLAGAAAALGLTGCAGTYDLITSERFKERPFHTLFSSDDPLETLEKVQEGDDRVRAMRDLKEPREHGGSAAQQDKVIAILQASATSERRPLCRLEDVSALARFKDPRAGQILIAAYTNATNDGGQPQAGDVTQAAVSGLAVKGAVSSFTPDTVTRIQCLALESLGRHRSPEALQLLVQVASAPTERPAKANGVEPAGASLSLEAAVSASEPDRVDVRLAAIRALGSYKGDATAAKALVAVLQAEKSDIAVRGRAHEALTNVTGQDLPPDGKAWQGWLDKGGKMK